MPRRWDAFLPNSQNRASLFQFISNCIKPKFFPGLRQKKMETAYNEVLWWPAKISPCNNMRKMTAGLFFTENMSKEGANQAMMFTADTDVAVIATSVFSELILLELWIEFGKTANRKYIPIYMKLKLLGPERVRCLCFIAWLGVMKCFFFKLWKKNGLEDMAKLPMVDWKFSKTVQ